MPFVEPVQSVRLPGWVGGLNLDADQFQLEISESPDALNVDFGLRGAVSKRKGYTRYDNPVEANLFRRLAAWNNRGGQHWLIAVRDAEIIYGSSNAFSNQATGWTIGTDFDDEFIGVAAFENVLYVTTKSGNPWQFDGTTWTEITDITLDGDDAGAHFPRAAFLETNYERVWAANLFDNTTEHASRVWYSAIGDATDWSPTDWIDVDPDDGTVITGLKVFGGNLMIFKERAVYTLSGSDENTFNLFPLDSDIGTTAPRSIQSEGDRIIFFDPLTGVWQFDGASFSKLDDKINLHLLDGINFSESHLSSAFIWQGRYFLSVPWGTDTYPSRTFVYDLRNEAWTQYDYGARHWAFRNDEPYAVGVNNANGIMSMFTGLNDNGTAISAYMETAWIETGEAATKSRLRRADFAFSALGNHNITVKMNRDFDQDFTFSKVVNTDPGGAVYGTALYGTDVYGVGVDQVYRTETGWGSRRWRQLQFRFEESALAGEMQLNRLVLHLSSLDRVRGEK